MEAPERRAAWRPSRAVTARPGRTCFASQAQGRYPAAFSAIRSPVLMLHGAQDPHPGDLVRDGLMRVLPQLEVTLWDRCGHHPWLERAVRGDFFERLRAWLSLH